MTINLPRLLDQIESFNWRLEPGVDGWTREVVERWISRARPVLVSWSILMRLRLIIFLQEYYDWMLHQGAGVDRRLRSPVLERIRRQILTWEAELATQPRPPTPVPPTTPPQPRLHSLPPIATVSDSSTDYDISPLPSPMLDASSSLLDVTELHLGSLPSVLVRSTAEITEDIPINILPPLPHTPWRPFAFVPIPPPPDLWSLQDGTPVRTRGQALERDAQRAMEATIRRRFGLDA